MREALCAAFCNDLTITEVPAGHAVSTTFLRDDGDAVGFFVIRDHSFPGRVRLEDDGSTVPFLEAAGVDFSTSARSEAFAELTAAHGVEFDEDEMLLRSGPLTLEELPRAAMRFVSMMIRMGDFLLLTKEKVASTFKEDALRALRERLGDKAVITEDAPVSPYLADNRPDALIRAPDRRPVAVFLGTSPQRVYEAILLHLQALYEAKEDVAVVALMETDGIINRDLRRRASNRLTALPTFRGDEMAAIDRIEREAVGLGLRTVH